MEELSVFDKLVDELSLRERRELLYKIENAVTVSEEPLGGENETATINDTEAAFQSLNPLLKLFFLLKGLFLGKKPLEAFEESLLSKLKKLITQQAPKLIDFRRELFLEYMKKELEGLQGSAGYFARLLANSYEKNRPEFITFLARCHSEALMKRLDEETDPRNIIAEKSLQEESDIKGEMDRRFREILGEFPEAERKSIYRDSQSLERLKTFSEIDFATLLNHFHYDPVRGESTCPVSEFSKRLLQLAGVLKNAKFPPSKTGLRALFLYGFREDRNRQKDFENYIKDEFSRAEAALVRIRNFNRDVPLGLIAKVLAGDYNYTIEGLKGGEDWFVLFKKYWAARLSRMFGEYSRNLRTVAVIDKAYALLGIRNFEGIKFYHPSFYPQKTTLAHWRSLSFILAFYKNVFIPKFSKGLKILFLNGEFYKTENRVEFTDTYNFLNTVNEKLFFFEKQLAPDTEIGKIIEALKKEKSSPDVILKKMEPVIKKADAQALTLVEDTINALKSLNKILNGILYSEAGGKYDTLSNISYIGGKENVLLRKDWEKIVGLSYEVYQVLHELRTVESP
jgi:hypothetical protein